MSNDYRLTRRELLGAAAVVAPLAIGGCAGASRRVGEDPPLRAEDPVARALAYYPDSSEVPAEHPLAATHQPAQTCANCIHALSGADAQVRSCPMFPGRSVNAAGWCSLWAPA